MRVCQLRSVGDPGPLENSNGDWFGFGLSTTASCRGYRRTATLLPTNTRDITKAILRFVLHLMLVTLACSGIHSVTHTTFELTLANASAAILSANVGWKYIEITPRHILRSQTTIFINSCSCFSYIWGLEPGFYLKT